MNGLFDILRDTSARDVLVTTLDVLLVYYVFYRVLLTIKGTRAAQMVIGIVAIGAAFLLAERIDMTTVSWLLDNFIQYFVIIVIVVFQQDIRRGLMRIGQNVVPFGRTHQLAYALDEVLAAAEHLAKARLGGIVVFEREAELGQFFEHGRAIDARVSKELLVTLFVPSRDNELHDGAVVISKALRIDRAGVLLPLSRSLTLGQEFGTRHRAALGITEETDAVALVISEERGEVSLCFKGSIARDMEMDTLRSALQRLFTDKDEGAKVAQEAQAAAEVARAMAALAGGGERALTAPPTPSTPATGIPVKVERPSSADGRPGRTTGRGATIERSGRHTVRPMEEPGT